MLPKLAERIPPHLAQSFIPRLVHLSELAMQRDARKLWVLITAPAGLPLSDFARSNGADMKRQLPGFAVDLALALDAVHTSIAGYIHSDVCPNNIIVHNNRARLIDFGAATITAMPGVAGQHGFIPRSVPGACAHSDWVSLGLTIYALHHGLD